MTPESLIHAMAERSQKKMRIAAVLPGGIYSYFAAAKKIRLEDGGPSITNPLLAGGNPNVAASTYYDQVPVSQTNELTTVKYDMARIVGSYVISKQEIDENAGSSKLVDLAIVKMRALEIAIKNFQRTKAASTNSGKDPLGIGNLLPSVVNSGTIGGINLSTQPMFRPSVYDYNGSMTQANIVDTFDNILLDLQSDDGKVSVIFTGRRIFNLHRNAAKEASAIQFGSTGFGQQLANLGLVGTTHQGIPLVYDENLHPDDAYFVNEQEMMIHILKNANMKLTKLTAPYDQDVIGARYSWEGNLCSWKNFRTHAYVTNRP